MSSVPGNRSALFFSVPIDGLIMLLGIFGLVSKESYFFYSGSLFEQTGVRQGTRRVSFWLPKSFWTKVSGLRSLPDAQGRWRKGLARTRCRWSSPAAGLRSFGGRYSLYSRPGSRDNSSPLPTPASDR